MSTQNPTHSGSNSQRLASRGSEYDHAPEDVFEAVIKSDETICQRCFRRQFAVAVVAVPMDTAETNGDLVNWVPVSEESEDDETACFETLEATENVETVHPPRVEDPLDQLDVPQSWKRATPPAQTVCECGAVDDDGSRPPLSVGDAKAHAERIADRLDDADVGFSREHLLGAVERFKRISAMASKDHEVFTHAVRVGVEKYRGRRLRSIRITEDGELDVKETA